MGLHHESENFYALHDDGDHDGHNIIGYSNYIR